MPLKYAKLQHGALFLCAVLLVAAPAPARAAALTSAQVGAIVALLQSFGADQTTVAKVQAALGGSSASASLSSVSFTAMPGPQNARLAPGAKLVPFTAFALSNRTGSPVEIYGITVNRTGTGSDSYLAQIELLDTAGNTVGEGAQLDRSHQAVVGSTFMLAAGESRELIIAGTIASRNKVQGNKTLSLEVVSINASGALSGSLPITGATYTTDRTLKP